jgi:hypothetical protein
MFMRAGFNQRHRVVLTARCWTKGRLVWAHLVVWLPSGDLGWYCLRPRFLGFLAWEIRGLADLIEGPPLGEHLLVGGRSRCCLEEAPRAGAQ